MLDDYKEMQPIAYKILKNAIENDKCSHAYLIETGDFYDYFNFTMSFVKSLLCPYKKLSKKNCGKCHQCEVIDSGNFPEIEIINPDGLWIKKDQLHTLQNDLSTKALIGNKRIYIINGADKLNKAAANSILKFLEEPDNNIIAILLTENIYNVLTTIKSRCQILKLKPSFISKISETKEENQKIVEFVNYYEKHHLDTILYINKLWNENIKSKEDQLRAFKIMIIYYKDILNYKLNKELEEFEITDEIKKISENNTIEQICDKINKLVELKEKIKYNANSNLLMDKLIITLEGGI